MWPEVVRRDATPIERVHISDRGRPGITRLRAQQFGVEALGYIVPARVLGLSLVDRLQAVGGDVDILCPATVSAIAAGPEQVVVEAELGDGQCRQVTARLAVLADGGRSRSRALVGIEAGERDYQQSAVLATVTPELNHHNTAYERFTSTGPLAMLPTSNRRCGVVWTTTREREQELLELPDDLFLARLQERFGDRLGQLRRPGKRASYPLTLIRIAKPIRPRLVVIGNAAHTIHPVAGQGFNLGLRDVATLAEVLNDAERAGRDIGGLDVLQGYVAARQRDIQAVTRFTDGLIRLFANDFPPAALVRNLGLLALDNLPLAKRMLVRRTMGLAGPLPRLARGLTLD